MKRPVTPTTSEDSVMLNASPHRGATDAETGLWLTERLGGAGANYHMPVPVRLRGPLDRARLAAACDAVVARHPALASRFEERDGAPVRLDAPAPRLEDGDDPDAAIREPFDLATGPLCRFTLHDQGPDGHLLLVVAHHLVFDGLSKDILLRDLAAAYRGEPLEAPVAAAQEQPPAEPDMAAAEAFWKERDARLDEVVLFGRTIAAPARPEAAGSVPVDLSRAAAAAERGGVSRFEATLAALHAVLRAHGNPDAAVAVDVSTRDDATAQTIGLFVNELPVPAGPADTFRDLGELLREEMRALRPFRQVPYARAVGGLRPRAALAPVSLSYRRRIDPPSFDGLDATVEWAPFLGMVRGVAHLLVVEGPDGTEAHLRHNTRLLDAAGARALADEVTGLLAAAADDPDAP
ncbi:condensation domain-containing protein, partial [Dactylosporangium sp. NPDC051485]|uniref:condensation domain-containing protein n=1 Tax=Dactylosporangium sp. NPDC051485 TaxID=3154846 RepID=UPI003436622E